MNDETTPVQPVGRVNAAIIAMICIGLIAGSSIDPPSGISGTRRQKTVDSVRRLAKACEFPKYFITDEAPIKKSGEFNANDYFGILDHLRMEQGFTLDWVYAHLGLGGRPFLYSREVTDRPFATFQEYEKVHGRRHPETLNREYQFWDHVVADGTDESYFQLVVMVVLCPQFCLWWHANYDDDLVVCDRAGLVKTVNATYFEHRLPDSVKKRALEIHDISPSVTVGRDTASVRVVIFSKWGGFSQCVFKFSAGYPHHLFVAERRVLVDYGCGVLF